MKQVLGILVLVFSFYFTLGASEKVEPISGEQVEEESFDPTEVIEHHIANSHQWHVLSYGEGEHQTDIEIPLPVILINEGKFHFFLFSRFNHETKLAEDNGCYFIYHHGTIYNSDAEGNIAIDENGHVLNSKPWDFSLTKNVWSMWLSIALLLWLFISIARKYKGEPKRPKGIQSLFEPIILFIKDDIIIDQIGKEKANKYVPYLLTLFFFIWINNLIGLVPFFPGGSNFTGNISVTMVLAMITFFITTINGSKSYWKHTLLAPGVPSVVKVILIPVEILGLFTKPFALMIRLMANITAGHIIIISLISLIFIMKSVFIAPASIGLAVVMSILELFVAILQAYIFTLLSALFIGMAIKDEEH